MKHNQIIFIFDAGNTSLKLGVFSDGELLKTYRFDYDDIEKIQNLYNNHLNPPVFISSVLADDKTLQLKSIFENVVIFDENTLIPIQNKYQSSTLGKDRIANAVAVNSLKDDQFGVAIDIGTCVKFDVVDKNGAFLGGSIAPGINMRYKSLHHFTGKLPLIQDFSRAKLIGTSTHESLHTGVILAMHIEIQGFINQFEKEFEDLTFFVTGGDAQYFDLSSKNNIFADENLTLKGLFLIYEYNVK